MNSTADELEIRNLVARLAHLADDGDLEEYVGLFTQDGTWEVSLSTATDIRSGHAAILAGARERRATGALGPGSNTRHVVTTLAVKVNGESADGRCYVMIMKDTKTAPMLSLMVVYSDSYRRTPGGWRLAARRIQPA